MELLAIQKNRLLTFPIGSRTVGGVTGKTQISEVAKVRLDVGGLAY